MNKNPSSITIQIKEASNYFLTFLANYALLTLLNPLPQLLSLAGLRICALLFIAFEPLVERFCLNAKTSEGWGVIGFLEDSIAFVKSLKEAKPQELAFIAVTLLYVLSYPAIGIAGFLFNERFAQILKSAADVTLTYQFGLRLYGNLRNQKPYTSYLSNQAESIKNTSHLAMMLELIHDECAGLIRVFGLKNLAKTLGFISLPPINRAIVALNATSLMHSSTQLIKSYYQKTTPLATELTPAKQPC